MTDFCSSTFGALVNPCCPHVQNNAAKVPLWRIKRDKVPSVGCNCVTTYRSLTLFWGL